ncbi:Maf family protein [Larsenimonas rhizosphaerae]|uniref:Maf family protein n=1 Tax=Larsenimonas rhizosphaerae TaxID=2944682 RepID=UPI002034273E|nr:Maf family nucleotide pyrophosphatase [Larsenimonas rhizosphaerae]
MTTSTRLWLASASPRRRELLASIGIMAEGQGVDIDETPRPDEAPLALVARLAEEKARAGHAGHPERVVLGSDTVVVVDNTILGKPADRDDFIATMQRLSGRRHQVMTGVCVIGPAGVLTDTVVTEVQFRTLTPDEPAAYWETGEPQDKAGGYAVQGLGAVFVTRLEGSYSAVVGLPLAESAALLARQGINAWQAAATDADR